MERNAVSIFGALVRCARTSFMSVYAQHLCVCHRDWFVTSHTSGIGNLWKRTRLFISVTLACRLISSSAPYSIIIDYVQLIDGS